MSAEGPELESSRAGLLIVLTAVQAEHGQYAAAIAGLEECCAIFERLRNKRAHCIALCNLSELFLIQGEIASGMTHAQQALEMATDMDFHVGIAANLRVIAMGQMDTGAIDAAGNSLTRALSYAESEAGIDRVATRFLCGRLALRMGDPEGSKAHLDAGIEAAREGDPESYGPLLKAMRARASIILGEDEKGIEGLKATEELLDALAVPRRAQVMVVLALSYQALAQPERALHYARESARLSAQRSFRLWGLVASSIVAVCTDGDEAAEARTAATDLAAELCGLIPPDLEQSFRERPRIRALLNPFDQAADSAESSATE